MSSNSTKKNGELVQEPVESFTAYSNYQDMLFQNDIAKVCADIEQFTQYIHHLFINILK